MLAESTGASVCGKDHCVIMSRILSLNVCRHRLDHRLPWPLRWQQETDPPLDSDYSLSQHLMKRELQLHVARTDHKSSGGQRARGFTRINVQFKPEPEDRFVPSPDVTLHLHSQFSVSESRNTGTKYHFIP